MPSSRGSSRPRADYLLCPLSLMFPVLAGTFFTSEPHGKPLIKGQEYEFSCQGAPEI